MLNITERKTPQDIKAYYIGSKSLEAYYSENQEFNGYWMGKGAERLGLKGYIQDDAFCRLADHLHPFTGAKLTQRAREDGIKGWDWTFDLGKSSSLVWAFGGKDDRIIRAIREATAETVADMEKAAAARVRANLGKNANGNRITGNIVAAEFVHLTARPENGYADPQIHVHILVFNCTFDEEEGKWKALQERIIHDEAPYYQGIFYMRAKEKLEALGLPMVMQKYGPEVEGIERPLIDKFSRRTKKIEETAKRLGITDPAEKAKLGKLTRNGKDKNLDITQLEPFWQAALSPEDKRLFNGFQTLLQRSRSAEVLPELEFIQPDIEEQGAFSRTVEALGQANRVKVKPHSRRSMNQRTAPRKIVETPCEPTEHDRRAVDFAVKHLFARHSVVTEKQLKTEAFQSWCVGRATRAGIEQVVAEMPFIRVDQGYRTLITTWEVLAEENRIIDRCKQGLWKHQAISPGWRIKDNQLNEGQRDAVFHVVGSQDLVVGIMGKSGTGKTRLALEAREAIVAGGKKFFMFTPGAEAAREMLPKAGFDNADTVARLLENQWVQKKVRGGVWWIDEAGLLSVPQMDKLLRLAEQLDARVVLVGDVGQHCSVERGKAFDLLQRRGEMTVTYVDEVVRQKGEYKRYVEYMAEGKVEDAFKSLRKMNALREIKDKEARAALLAKRYLETVEKGKTALVVSPTHAECKVVTDAIRHELRQKKVLRAGVQRNVLRNLSWTDAQKSDPDHYEPGLVVQINKHQKGFALGERLSVVSANEDSVVVRNQEEEIKTLPIWKPEVFGVYERDAIEVCVGDRLRITANGYTEDEHRLNNGNLYGVKAVAKDGTLTLDNGWEITSEFVHLHYGYATTSHSAQGKSVDWVFVSQSPDLSGPAGDMEQFYVATSRGIEGLEIVTSNIEKLFQSASRHRERLMATDILADERTEQEQAFDEQRNELEKREAEMLRGEDCETEKTPSPSPEQKIQPSAGAMGHVSKKEIVAQIGAVLIEQMEQKKQRHLAIAV